MARTTRQAPARLRAFAHIHLAHAGVPPRGPDQALIFFVADEFLEAAAAAAE